MSNSKHDYLVALIRELEKQNNSVYLSTFWAKVEGELKMRKRLHGYIDLPIGEEQYDTLIATAEHLLGVEHKETEPQSLQDLFDEFEKNNPDFDVRKVSDIVMDEYSDAYAALADSMVREKIGFEDEGWLDELVDIVVSIKSLESQDNLTDEQRATIKELRAKLENHLFGNI